MQKLIVVIGPTAAKKTTLAHELAQKINGAIINGDAFQIYKEINVGVNKPDFKKRQEVDYYLIDKLNLLDSYSIYDYQKDFDQAYQAIVAKQQIPILCGGSHLYIDSVLKGYNLNETAIQSMTEKIKNWTEKEINDYLLKYDPLTYQKVFNNKRRAIRAVAFLLTHNNKPKAEWIKENNQPKYSSFVIWVTKNKATLDHDINLRCLKMLENNQWTNEINNLINKYGHSVLETQGFKAIGYLDIANAMLSNREIDINKIQQKTRKLSKHQNTWCRNKFVANVVLEYNDYNLNHLVELVKHFFYD